MVEAGHNSELTDKEKRALQMDHIRKIMAQKGRVNVEKGAYNQLRKTAKADGFKLSLIDAGIRLLELEDQSIFMDEIRELYGIAQDFGVAPQGDQMDLFADRRPLEDRAFEEGKAAGLAALKREAPYGADSSEGQAWLRGYDEGQAEMRDALQSAMEKKNAAEDKTEVIKGGDDPFPDPEEDDTEDGGRDNVVPMNAAE